jgi:hypothetical protein
MPGLGKKADLFVGKKQFLCAVPQMCLEDAAVGFRACPG